jgi:predicted phosphodiesterase
MIANATRFLHLSDIHFRYSISDGPYDLDEVIRNELLLDANAEAKRLGGVHGVLVTGDIAFGGKCDEYDTAYKWLNTLCSQIECSFKNIWTVPGNHDVDRTKIKPNPLSELLRGELRDIPLQSLNDVLMRHLENAQSRELLFGPLEQYNLFAAKLSNRLSTANPLFWENDVTLSDGSALRLWGLNSVIISDENDHDREDRLKLLLSSFQTKFLRTPGVVYLTMCHHPLEWLRDHYEVEGWLDVHARVQLFGHRHTQRVRQVADNIRVAAGAMHPDRGEPGWEPRYNFISLQARQDERGRKLRIDVHPRVWNDVAKQFVQDSLGIFSRELPLPDWQPVSLLQQTHAELTEHADLSSVVAAIKSDLIDIEDRAVAGNISILNAGEKLTSRYMSLPRRLRLAIATNLNLVDEADKEISDTELYRRYFRRAKERKILERLWKEVEAVYVAQGEPPSRDNPFAGS